MDGTAHAKDLESMEKITNQASEAKSADPIAENIAQLRYLFPELVTEGPEGTAINVDVLKQLVGDQTVTDAEEKYGLNWHGKRRARQLALTPSTGTLRPCPEESVDWDTTQNLMIEGDNLEVLKLLQKSYSGKVKLIYIDPPYNTGDDFVYSDDFHDNLRNYLELTSQIDGGKRISSNSEASGRFHTNWLNSLYPRVKIARNLLRDDGVIVVSIDDREVVRLKNILDEIFGEENFEGQIHWRRRHNQPNDPTKMIALVAEHILVYTRDKQAYKASGVGKVSLTGDFANPDNDPRGDWASKPWKAGSGQSGSSYAITTPTGRVYEEEWMGEEDTYKRLLADNRIVFPDKGNGSPRKKYFRFEREEEGQCATNWWPHDQFGHNQEASSDLENLLGRKNVFSNPKPVRLLSAILSVANTNKSSIVMDFFAGSGTTGHAVMKQNVEDGGNRRFILVQLPEPLDLENKDQVIAAEFCKKLKKPLNISELTKERLRRAARKIKDETPLFHGDLGFRVFKLDSTNIREWDPAPVYLENALLEHTEHIKAGRAEQDLLYELLLKLGLDLCVPMETRSVAAGKRQHQITSIGGGVLMACLSESIPREDVEPLGLALAAWHQELNPAGETTCVFLDSAFADDVAKTNMSAILTQHGFTRVRSL